VTSRHRAVLVGASALVAAMLTVTTLSGCSFTASGRAVQSGSGATGPAEPRSPSTAIPVQPANTKDYAEAVHAALHHGLKVWLEADLVSRWQQGSGSFESALMQIGALARIPGVAGVKIADELGYHDGMNSTSQISTFLSASAAGLGRVAPGKAILVDMSVPQLGCLPEHQPPLLWSTECTVKLAGQYPQLTLGAVTSYLRLGAISVLDLSTGLLPDKTYTGWGSGRDTAQDYAWAEARRLGWSRLVTLHARKALAHPGSDTDSESTVAAAVHTWVDIPLESGASAVDVWTWRQAYRGSMYRILDPHLKPNALWEQLRIRRAHGAILFTHLSPHSLEVGMDADLAVLAQVFTGVFVAAGTG
jgi:hypothetical protein